ncbi:MAG: SpoIIIAH-like family protein [Clostridia bacterium]|nr:SpoIIIAH-like family protein [Clostridia bacterium]
MNIKNIFKKNQIIVYTMALMLVAAGYLNYTNNLKENEIQTSVQEVRNDEIGESAYEEIPNQNSESNIKNEIEGEEKEKTTDENKKMEENQKVAEIGDAMLVNSNDVIGDNYFAKSKIEREAMYSQMKETYQTILNSPNSTESQKEKASVEMAKINETKNCIMICENLLETKGFKNCVIFVNDGNISVIVEAKELKPEQTAQIQNIISRELGAIIENIHISVK